MSARVVQAATFVTPTSGGLRTCLENLATGYAAAGHDVVQVVPGERDEVRRSPWGRTISVRSPLVPGTGYRLVVRPDRVRRLLDGLGPDRLEVHDRTTLRGLGAWARARGVPSLVVSHERADRVLASWTGARLVPRGLVAASEARLADSFDRVVCTTAFAAAPFEGLGRRVDVVPLGVDLAIFSPERRDAALAGALARDGRPLLVVTSRLSREKRVDVAVDAVAELGRGGVAVRLVVAGHGPAEASLRRRAAGLPVTFLGHVGDRAALARLMASADLGLAPGPAETFGLAALETLATGTPVVVDARSALPGVVGRGGLAAHDVAGAADAIEALLSLPAAVTRGRAREQAERFPWSRTVRGFLDVHGLAAPSGPGGRPSGGPAAVEAARAEVAA